MSVPNKRLDRFLDTNGDGTGDFNIVDNYTSDTTFFIQPPEDEVYILGEAVINVTGTGNFAPDEYGGSSSLINGLTFALLQGNEELRISKTRIFNNIDWFKFTNNVVLEKSQNISCISIHWDLEVVSSGLVLRGNSGDKLSLIVKDDFTGIDSHTFFIRAETIDSKHSYYK